MTEELEWDSLDSGRLHHATSPAVTADGARIIVGVLHQLALLPDVVADADASREARDGWEDAPLWLYVPAELGIKAPDVVVRPIPTAR